MCTHAVTIVIAPEEENDVFAGTTNIFTCVATGIPNPSITWWKDGTQVLSDDRIDITMTTQEIDGVIFVTSILQICNITIANDGNYQCVAEVPRLTDTADFNIYVQSQVPVIEAISPDLTVVTGTAVTLECSASGAPLPTISWFKDEIEAEGNVTVIIVNTDTVNSTIELGPVNTSAEYTCQAVNNLGVDNAIIVITVQCTYVQ